MGGLFEGCALVISPGLESAQRALTVEASVPNPTGQLKPGLFATARIEQPVKTPAVLVPASAVQTSGGTSRVYVVNGNHVDERIVTVGQAPGETVENGESVGRAGHVATDA